jgi:hypothetical protein
MILRVILVKRKRRLVRMKRKRMSLRIAFIVGLMILATLTFNPKPASSHRITEYKVLSAAEGLDPRPLNIALSANRSYVYFTEEYTGRIGAMEAQERNGGGRRFVEYVLPFKPDLGYSEPWDLDVIPGSPGDKLFYTDYHQNQIGRLEIGSGPSCPFLHGIYLLRARGLGGSSP